LNDEIEARRRAEFLVDLMSHDINNINQGLQMLLEYIAIDHNVSENYNEPLRLALEQVQYITDLIRNVKKLQSVLEEPVELKLVDPYKAIQKAAEAAQRAFTHKTLELNIDFEEDQIHVLADDFLSDLFFNLFHNSFKHTPSKTVQIDIDANVNEISKKVEISIMDHGPGIPDEEKKRILQRRLGAKGSGIGLTIVNYLIDRYDGDIQVKDRIDGVQSSGSRFILILGAGP
jgi:signal transduction histidine kinase